MTKAAQAKRPRGRPIGTRKREHAYAAAAAIRAGQFDDVQLAALAYFHAHIGSKLPTPTLDEALKVERFRDFVSYVIEALRDQMTLREWRDLRHVFASRNKHARIRKRRDSVYQLRVELGIIEP